MLTLPGTSVYVEKISYIWVEVRAAQTLSSNHRNELPRAGTSRGAATYCRVLVQSRVVNLAEGKWNETGLESYVEQPCKINQ